MRFEELFDAPGPQFRQAPFWFWNHDLDPEMLLWQIEEMRDKGIGGFVMHARHGLITPYLSDKWFDCVRTCCNRARELGMWAWAYDERDWPSGPAGGKVIEDADNRLHYLRADTGDMTECPAILWFDSYLDTLSETACAAFIDSTYEKYAAALGDLYALGIKGFFTDEPAFSTYPDDLRRVPWTAELPAIFRREKGYDLLEHLPSLIEPGGRQVRYDYWDVASRLLEKSFFEQISQWCEQRGLQLIGHPLGEEPLLYQFRTLGTAFRHLKHLHMPGMDHLEIQVGKGQPGAMSPKVVASAALLAGRERVMTETFGESGWKLTLREMKWMADWQMANGVNYIIPHAFYYSVSRRRKKDSPPSEFYHAPFWPHYRCFADYTARVTAAVTGGEHVAKVAVLYPISSVWADFMPGDDVGDSVRNLDERFRQLCENLQRIHRDFVLVDEDSFAAAQVADKKFTVAGLSFDALVVPGMSAVTRKSLEVLKTISGHALVVVIDPKPWTVLVPQGPEPASEFDPSSLPGAVVATSAEGPLSAALSPIPADVIIENAPDVQYLHKRRDGKDVYFFVNTGKGPIHTRASIEGQGAAEIWDAETGRKYPAPGQTYADGRIELAMDLPYAGSCLVVVDPESQPVEAPVIQFNPGRRIRLGNVWHFTAEGGNFLALDKWELTMRQAQHVTELAYTTHFVTPERVASLRLILDGVPERAYNVKEGARPIMARETDAVIYMDGEQITKDLPWEIDPQFRVVDLRELARPGSHELKILIKNNGWIPQPGLEELAWLAGDFRIDFESHGPCLMPVRGIKTGPWEEQGFPFFSGTGAYFTEAELPADIGGKRIFLNAGKVAHLLQLEVNTRLVGVRPWPPYRLDVTDYVKPGWNQFMLKVTNSAKNFFEGPDNDFPSGLLTDPVLEIGE